MANSYSKAAPFLFVAAAFLLYAKTISFSFFIFDDASHITHNLRLHPVSVKSMIEIWTTSLMPVVYSYWAMIAAIFGTESAAPFRVANIFLHGINSWLVMLFVLRVLASFFPSRDRTSMVFPAFLGGVLFLVHPVQVEAAAWVSCSKDLLSFFFGMIAAMIHFSRRSDPNGSSKGTVLTYCFLAAAVLSKISASAFVLIFILMDRVLFQRDWRSVAREYLPATGVVLIVLSLWFQLSWLSADSVAGWGWRMLLAFDASSFTVYKLFLPWELVFDYGRSPAVVIQQFRDIPGLMIAQVVATLVLVVAAVVPGRDPRRLVFQTALGVLLLAQLPYSGLIPFGFQLASSVADRYFYLPLLGVSLMLGAGLFLFPARKMVASALLIVGAFALKSGFQASLWKDSLTILSYSVEKQPIGVAARSGLAEALKVAGFHDRALREAQVVEFLFTNVHSVPRITWNSKSSESVDNDP